MEEGSDDSEEECDRKESLGDDFTGISAASKCKNKGTDSYAKWILAECYFLM